MLEIMGFWMWRLDVGDKATSTPCVPMPARYTITTGSMFNSVKSEHRKQGYKVTHPLR